MLRLVNYVVRSDETPTARTGFLNSAGVMDFGRLSEACSDVKSGCDCPSCWQSALGVLICPECLDAARRYAAWAEAQDAATLADLALPLEEVRLLAPVPNPGKLFCLAQNFPSHAAESNRHITRAGESVADAMTPHVFLKPVPNTVCGEGDPIPITPTAQFIDYEAEVAIVIGKAGKYIRAEEAADYIAGVTALNDVSERRLKLWERKDEREWDKFFDWLNGKWMDHFAPMGPCVVPASDLNLNNLSLRGYVNDELRQVGNTSEMFHSAAKTVEYISLMLTLEPGDVIALGTPAGVGAARGTKLVPGDVVRVEVEGVGALTNPVVAE
jgi:2,4-diketo-3-deoxy-L-fuconate hydrolase